MQVEAYADGLASVKSEAKPGLHFDYSTSQGLLGFPEVPIARRCTACRDVSLEVPEVQLIKQIIKISSEFDVGVFSEHG